MLQERAANERGCAFVCPPEITLNLRFLWPALSDKYFLGMMAGAITRK